MKRLVLCCDGTWNRADQERQGEPCPTNVVKLAYRVAKRGADGTSQVVFYDQGVGTGNALDRFSGGAFGRGIEENIFDAYRFLIANYEAGDEIWVFGFSRGAFTARSLMGMVRKCGILTRISMREYRDALGLYRNRAVRPDDPPARRFRETHSVCGEQTIPIHFVGVWDTVGALGIPLRGLRWLTLRDYEFHDTELSGSVRHAYHALAIDERRRPFEPTLWMEKPKPGQTVEQVWFPGVHSDVGGGYPQNDLSDITLAWMLGKATDAGLALDQSVLAARPLAPDPTGALHESKKGLYRLTRGLTRPIGVGGTQHVHEAALTRWDRDARYRPDNLREYLRATASPRAAG